GANGYLGKYVIAEAIQQGYKIIGFKFNHIRSTIIDHPDIQYINCDISKPISKQSGIKEIISNRNIAGIINTAALLGSSDYNKNYEVNGLGVKNIMDFAKEINVSKIVQISSVVVLKSIKGPYGVTKLKGQEFLINSDFDYTVFIPALILGPESLGINRILKNVFRFPFFVPLIGTGIQTQHPVYIKDFAKYIVKSVGNQASKQKVYEIAGDTVISFKNLIKLILKIKKKTKIFIPVPVFIASTLGKIFQTTQKVPVFTAEHVKGVLQDSKLNTTMLIKDMDYKPTPLEIAMAETLEKINHNWDKYLDIHEEKVIQIKEFV
ncbi:MAG: NAD-dependent epimerase/dehydratase family protein, partial [Bacteroidota bacterium]|nr:NAD-dependent epimerase/dehydratase family protein [Bacteroidota bacterium]